MAITRVNSTMPGAVTPICNTCGILLCWDISEEEYQDDKAFWDDWICQDCNGGKPKSLKSWRLQYRNKPTNQ